MAQFGPDEQGKPAATDTPQPEGMPVEKTALPEVEKAHLTAAEAAVYMGIPLEAFKVLAADPELQPVRIRDAYLYRTADVQRFMLKMEADDNE